MVEDLPSKYKALNSNPNHQKKILRNESHEWHDSQVFINILFLKSVNVDVLYKNKTDI
jgi:hypothetical protein